ncbi:MAG: invasion associated locus B family protein [Hyphomicrobiales bacterium]
MNLVLDFLKVAVYSTLIILVCGIPDVSAQTKQPAKPPAATPAPAPAAAPTIVSVKPEPSQATWLKVCGDDQNTKKKICYTTRDFVSDQNQPVLAVAIYDIQGDQQKIVRFLMPLGFILAPGVRFNVDKGTGYSGKFGICFPVGCYAEVAVKDDALQAIKKGTSLFVSVQNQFAREVAFQVPMEGFAKAFDGPPVDPALLADQQQKLQEQMKKQAEELRRKMGADGQGTTSGEPPTTPDPNAPAKQP